MSEELQFIKPEVRGLTAYSLKHHTTDIKLNQNENPFGFPDALKDEVWEQLRRRDWARYPDFYLRTITQGVAELAGVPADRVLVGNGSNELLQMVLLATLSRGDHLVVPVPTFTLYRLQATAMGATVTEPPLVRPDFRLPVDDILTTIERDRPQVVVLCSPNNPTGNVYAEDEARTLADALSEGLLLLDEAYFEFSGQDFRPLLDDYANVALLRTFSKAWGLAGARVGYMLAHPDLIAQIAKIKLPYGLNILSETAALVALTHKDVLAEHVAQLAAERDRLQQALGQLPGVYAYPSQANFILCRFEYSTGDIFDACLQAGILVRDVSHYPGLAGHLRISVGTRAENAALFHTLSDFILD
jgi:histidinol-phosphate aminotransferase